jgi:hypothetical protein
LAVVSYIGSSALPIALASAERIVPSIAEQKLHPGPSKAAFGSIVDWLRENRRDNSLVTSENA